MIELELPYPPTANNLFFVRNGRKVLSAAGRAYHAAVAALAAGRGRMPPGRLAVALDVFVPDRRRRDLGNLEKVACDGAVKAGLFEDDSLIDVLVLTRRGPEKPGRLVMRIWTLEELTCCPLCRGEKWSIFPTSACS